MSFLFFGANVNICKVLNVCFFVCLLFLGGCSTNEAKWEEVDALISLNNLDANERALKICKEIEADDPTAKRGKVGIDHWVSELEKTIAAQKKTKELEKILQDGERDRRDMERALNN